MGYNFHVIVNHFPIALLTVYALLELVRFRKLVAQTYWFYIKATFVILGVLGAKATILTGKMIEERYEHLQDIVEAHERWAYISTLIFGIISLGYLATLIVREFEARQRVAPSLIGKIHTLLFRPGFLVPAALVGLIALIVTGALGGIISYGPSVDPIASLVNRLLLK